MKNLQRQERKELDEALRDAFDRSSFDRMLSYELDKRLENLATGNFADIVFEVIAISEREGWVVDLIQAAHETVPGNEKLHTFAKKMGLAYDTPPPDKLRQMLLQFSEEFDLPDDMSETEQFERMLLAFSRELNLAPDMLRWQKRSELQPVGTLFHPVMLAEKITALKEQVCRIQFGIGKATGFRVGPDIVMTTYHVLREFIENRQPAEEITVQFGYFLEQSGETNPMREFKLPVSDWLVDYSPYSAHDGSPMGVHSQTVPDLNELDYALIRVKDLAEDGSGWIGIPSEEIEYQPGSSLHIIQHLMAGPLQIALQPNSVIGLNQNRTRLFHRTWTQPGSSGAPCFNQAWQLIGVHRGREPGPIRTYNVGVPITAVADLLAQRGMSDLLAS